MLPASWSARVPTTKSRSVVHVGHMVSRAVALGIAAYCLGACRAQPLDIDVVEALESLCSNHDAGSCSALARLHEVGSNSNAWYDCSAWPRRIQVSVRAGDKQRAIHLYASACSEGSRGDCERHSELTRAMQPHAAP